jgi:phosphopantothenoylcysteine decarboxylase/phosphopantothenate--cysteine ligase
MARIAPLLESRGALELPGGRALEGKHILVTAGPTHEPIDPVRVIANRSSGKQGFAIAARRRSRGARVSLSSGPVRSAPLGVARIDRGRRSRWRTRSGRLPADCAIMWLRRGLARPSCSPTS